MEKYQVYICRTHYEICMLFYMYFYKQNIKLIRLFKTENIHISAKLKFHAYYTNMYNLKITCYPICRLMQNVNHQKSTFLMYSAFSNFVLLFKLKIRMYSAKPSKNNIQVYTYTLYHLTEKKISYRKIHFVRIK